MADEPMLSLFDTDTSFLDELAGETSSMGPPGGMDTSLINSGMAGMQSSPMLSSITQPQQQPQSQQSYLSGNQYSRMPFQSSIPSQPQYNADNYNQYNPVPKLHHINNTAAVAGGNQGQIMMARSSKSDDFPTATTTTTTTTQQQQQANNQQQMRNISQMSPYLHHDYAISNQSGQITGMTQQFSDNSKTNQATLFMQRMGSPPVSNRPIGQVASPSPVTTLQSRTMQPNQPTFQSTQQPVSQMAVRQTSYSNAQQVQLPQQSPQHQQYSTELMRQGPQLTSGTNNQQGTFQRFPYTQQQPVQQPAQVQMSQSMGENAPPLSHFPNTSPSNRTAQYMSQYQGVPQQHATAPSPRPTPPPPSLTPEIGPSHNTNTSQGNFAQSSLQQLEQLVPSVAASTVQTTPHYPQGVMSSPVPNQRPVSSSPFNSGAYQSNVSNQLPPQLTQISMTSPASMSPNSIPSSVASGHVTLSTINQSPTELPLLQSQPLQQQTIVLQPQTQVLGEVSQNSSPAVKTKKPRVRKPKKQQDKADLIIAEAVAKAKAEGNTAIPRVVATPEIPLTVGEVDKAEEKTDKEKKKKKKERKPKVKKEGSDESSKTGEDGENKEKKEKKEKKPKATKIKFLKKKRKPPATFLKKKKRKRNDDSDVSDGEIKATPPPSPENEDENAIHKRRSGRHIKRKKYLDDIDLNLSDDDPDVDVEGADGPIVKPVSDSYTLGAELFVVIDGHVEEEAIVVEKILGSRMRKRDTDEEEYFVKYKNFSFLHCEWKTAREMELDKRIHQKIKRYKQKKLQNNNYFTELDDEDLFNPDYVEVDRVLDCVKTVDPVTEDELNHYLVKWRGLSYEESTWELQQDVDPEKVKAYVKFNEPPAEEEREPKPRPKPSDWKQLEVSHKYKGGNSLREYQLEGVNWLTFSYCNKQNCILADEMGLGKTIQSITFLNEVFLFGIEGPYLVIAPLSTIPNWQREFETWTDMNVIVYHGTSISRNMLQEYEMYYKDENGKRIPDVYRFNALITTYEIIISDCEVLSQIDWRCLIIDEAHRLKNRNCRLMEGLKLFDCDHRVLLTGTPLQNNVQELYSLLNFLEPEQFACQEAFAAEFGDLKSENQVEKLQSILKPMMLRRLKEDVEKNLAAKEETIIEVELTNIQKKYYRAILERNFTFLSKGTESAVTTPYLIKGAEEKILCDAKEKFEGDPEHMFLAMIQSSGKLVLLDKLLPKLKQNGHKVLVFSQMIKVLDILEDYLIHKHYLYERLDGRIRGNIRQEAIDRFSKPDSDRFVFLLCTRAGGLGINLTAADTVIIYDSDWNPQNDLQAQARCHRIGQSKAVKVYRLITRNSYEREMFDRASLKLGLDKAVLQSMGGGDKVVNPQAQLSKKEVEDLLRKGAYGALMDENEDGDKFCEEDIDQILKGRTQVIQIESEGKGSTFSKASFSMTGNRTDIDINDPNFWQMWAKKADLDVEALENRNALIIEEPRQRKQTARYGNEDSVLNMSELESSSESGGEEEEGGGGGGGSAVKVRGRRTKHGRRGRRRDDDDFDFSNGPGVGDGSEDGFGRSECFKVEKNLLVYGWGRWTDILGHGRFKKKLTEKDVESISRCLLLYSLKYYKGDEKIKEFIFDLVSPSNDGVLKNHSGLSAPVPRGRKGKKAKESKRNDSLFELEKMNMELDPEVMLVDTGYKRHLQRHSNKVLLRVRLLYYLKQEIIGDQEEKVFQNAPNFEIDIPHPPFDGERPADWWDEEADKSLLIGAFKHGYEKYNLMRQDAALCFLSICGPPDGAALLAEMNDDENDDIDEKPGNVTTVEDVDDEDSISVDPEISKSKPSSPAPPSVPKVPMEDEGDKLPFPGPSELNTRLRRVITSYQRNHKKAQLKQAQQARRLEKKERIEAAFKEREIRRRDLQRMNYAIRWSRREESDFYRVVSSFGVEFDCHTGRYKWDRFRVLARLDKKPDEALTEYFQAFYHMCLRVCRRFRSEEEAIPPSDIVVEPITEERASRCIARIDLLNKCRSEVLIHPKFDERIKLCQPSYDLPSWWLCGKHDRDLVIGAARHGVSRTDYLILHDPSLCFREILMNKNLQMPSSPYRSSPLSVNMPNTYLIWSSVYTLKDIPMLSKPIFFSTSDNMKDEESDIDIKENKENIDKENKNMESSDTKLNETKPDKTEVKSEAEETKSIIDKCKEVNSEHESELDSGEIKMETEDNEVETDEIKMETEEIDKKPDEKIKEENKDVKTEIKEEGDDDDGVLKLKTEIKPEVDETNDFETNVDTEDVKAEAETENLKAEAETKDLKIEAEMEDVKAEAEENPDSKMKETILENGEDRIVFHRLEHICYCVETGEWPFPKRVPISSYDSRSGTPVGSSTPKPEGEGVAYPEIAEPLMEATKVNRSFSDLDKDFEVQFSEGEGLKLTFHKRRGRRRKLDIEAEKARLLMNQGTPSTMSSDNESQPEPLNMAPSESQVFGNSPRLTFHPYFNQSPAEAMLNGNHPTYHEFDPALINRSLVNGTLTPVSRERRRGRKRKAEKMAEIAMAEALARREQARLVALLDPDARVSVINLEDGSILTGDKAPKKKNIERWLEENPGYIVDRPDITEEELAMESQELPEKRRGRRPRLDPALLDYEKLSGEENVSVINRLTGKKITGAKAPPLRYLAEWLEQNPMFDVDSKWADLVKAKGNLPRMLYSRLLGDRRRGRPKDGAFTHPLLSTELATQAAQMNAFASLGNAGLLPGFPKMPMNMPFGALPNLGLSNPMLGIPGFSIPGFALPSLGKSTESESKKDLKTPEKKDSEKKDSRSPSCSSATTPHPSFPIMYNPLMYSPLLAAQGMRNMTLPSGIPTSFASLAQSSVLNGQADSETEEGEIKRHSLSHKRTSVSRSHPQDVAEDLSFKKTSHAEKHRHAEKTETHSTKKEKSALLEKSVEDQPTDLSMKSKPKDYKNKQKILNSNKLSKIVDSLKDKVLKLEKDEKFKDKETISESSKPTADECVEKSSHSDDKSDEATEIVDEKSSSLPAAALKEVADDSIAEVETETT
ncbi:hypothetical protein ScPMuIL_000505 [Solemya velum]